MKKINLIEWLWKTDGHEKQKPQRFGRYAAMLIMLLTLSVGQMWADDCGFWADGAASITFTLNGSTDKTPSDLNGTGVGDYSIGTVTTSLTIKSAWAKVWGRDKFNSITLYYRVKEADAASSAAYSSASLGWDNNFGSNDQFWQNASINASINIALAPGDYEIEYYFFADAKYESDKYLSNGSGNYHANFTIPSKNLTVAGAGNGNTVSGNQTGITKGVAYNISATPTTGYTFGSWSATSGSSSISIGNTGSASTTVTFSNYSNNATVTASFNETMSTVSLVASPSGKGSFTIGGAAATSTTAGVTTTRSVTAVPGTGYTFGSWAITGGASISSTSTNPTTVTGGGAGTAATLTCTFSPKQCTITFDKNGGANGDNGTTGTYDAAMPTITPPTRDHYTFAGYWDAETNNNGSGTQYYNADGTSTRNWNKNTTSTTTLYAKWTEITHEVRVNTNTHATTSPNSWTAFGEVTGGTVSATSISTGYRFNGWSSDKGGTFADASSASTTFYPTTNDTWVTASIVAKTYSVTLDKNGGDSNGSATATYASSTISSFTGASRAGYSTDGYYTDPSAGVKILNSDGTLVTYSASVSSYINTSDQWKYDNNITLYPHWEVNATYYTLNYGVGTTSDGHVTVSAAKTSDESAISTGASLVSGTGVTITATPATHYKFVGWYTTAACLSRVSTSNPYSFSMDANTNLYAKVELMTTTVSFNKNGGTGSTPASATATHGNNTLSTSITNPTKTGYNFAGWYDAEDGGNKVFGSGGVITASSGYADGSQNWTYTGTALTVYAHWTAKTYKVTFNKQSGAGGSDNVTATYNAAMPSATMPTRTGYDFQGYYGSTGGSGTKYYNSDASSAHVWDVASATTIYAYWTVHNYSITYSPASAPTGCTYTTKPTSGTYGSTITMVITPSTGYTVSVSAVDASSNTVTISNPSTNTYTFTQPASAVTVTVTATETMSTLTTANSYDGANPSWSAPTKSVSSIGISTTATVTAHANDLGYTLTSWTITGGVRTDGGGANANPITVRSNGDGAAVSVTANYVGSNRSVDIYLPNTGNSWSTSDNNWRFYKLPGESGETVTLAVDIDKYDYSSSSYKLGFNVYHQGWGSEWWHNRSDYDTNMDAHNCTNWGFNTSDGDFKTNLDLNVSGTYTFTLANSNNSATQALTVTYPDKSFVEGNFPTAWDEDAYELVEDGNIQSVTINITSTGDKEFRLVSHGKLFGTTSHFSKASNSQTLSAKNMADDGAVMTLEAYVTGNYTFSYNKSTKVLTVTYPIYNQVRISAALPADATNVGNFDLSSPVSNVRTVTRSLAANTTYTFKVVYESEWYGFDSGTFTRNSSTSSNSRTITTSGGNMTLTTDFAGDYTFNFNQSTKVLSVTYPTAYTVEFGSDGHGTVTASATTGGSFSSGAYVKSGDVVTFSESNDDGYTIKGWYTTADGSTPAGLNGDNELTINGPKTVYAQYNANNYTVSFNVNGGTASKPDDKEVTFGSAYGTLPGGMTHTSKTFVGWYTDPDDGEGDLITAETIVSTASDHTLYAHYENVYSVNVTFKSGSATVYPSTSVNASPTSLAPTITAPEIFGYTFVNWTGSNASFGDASSATTTVNATAATTVTANYNVVPTVYFKNNLDWDSVFVTFDCGFNSSKENVPHNNGKAYYKMTQIGSTDVFYCEIPASYISSWTGKIAFDNFNYGKTGSTTHVGTWDAFYGGECAGRGDFDANATLYIPYSGESQSRNSTKFYQTGCWMKYNSTESGYQVNMNTWVNGEHADTLCVALEAANAGGYEFSAKLNLTHADYSYGFKLYKIYNSITDDLWYTNTGAIYASTESLPWDFKSGSKITATSQRCELHTEALGDYTITVSFATGRPMVNVEYPASVGDWRLAYNDRIAWSGEAHGESWFLYSRVVKAKANAEDLVSFYVSKAVGANAHVELQKCTAISAGGVETWTKQGDNLDLSSITGTGIYNFKITQNGSKVATAAYDGPYSGNFYIRTDASDGGWNNYIASGKNIMTYSEYAKDNSGFTHYFMRFVRTGSNIKFCIANDYSACLTEYCVSDDYTNEYIEADGNVRFMWDHRTNKVSRAYISGSSIVADRFLVLEGSDKMYNESGLDLTTAGGGKVAGLNDYEMNFRDDQNWIYEATIKAKPGAKALLTAKYNNMIQYFGGSGPLITDSVLLIGGSDTNKYKVRVVYDFKTNRLIKAFIPDGNIGTELAIDADMMIIREHQEDAQQVTFTEGGALSKVKTVYGAMQFNKYTVNGKAKTGGHAATGDSRYKRDLFYISFPFDVKLSEAFGFGTYGKHWIIEYYDGKSRAKNGFWLDSEPNWKFVWPSQRSSFTMKAFEGYILALELDEMTESSSVWDNGVEDVYVYFPSDGAVENIEATNRLVTIDQDGYECTINRSTPKGDRRTADSYWHCIGVPSFANYSSALTDGEGGATIDWRSTSMPYLYEWDSKENSVAITSTATFSFKATYSYLVQYAGESIYWSSVNATPAAIVARQRTAPKDVEFRMELQQNEQKVDQTFIKLTSDENVTTGYDFNYDLSKEFNSKKSNIYTMVTTVREDGPSVSDVAGNVLPLTEQTTVVPVGVVAKTTGDYTFAIPDGTSGIGVTLIDNETGIRTPLSALDYTINLSAGTYDNRFVLEISPIMHMPTGIEEIADDAQLTGARKVMIDGIMYIVRDNKVFDAQGKRVR